MANLRAPVSRCTCIQTQTEWRQMLLIIIESLQPTHKTSSFMCHFNSQSSINHFGVTPEWSVTREDEVPCPWTQYRNKDVRTLNGEKHEISLKTHLHQLKWVNITHIFCLVWDQNICKSWCLNTHSGPNNVIKYGKNTTTVEPAYRIKGCWGAVYRALGARRCYTATL